MKKLLYLMGIDWYWIKQRPQIIAENLARDFDLTVAYYREVFVKQSLRTENDELEKSFPIPAIPFRDKNKLAFFIQRCFFNKINKNIQEQDIIWITHPLLYNYVPQKYRGKIIYDCMDNHVELCKDPKIRKKIEIAEDRLVSRADIVFVSSFGLEKKMKTLNNSVMPLLVRNGFVLDKIHFEANRESGKNTYQIGYFGTIAEWFDFSVLLDSLKCFPQLEYHLWGPINNVVVPEHPRLISEGVIEHSQLWNHVKKMDCFIMPFKVTKAIADVDPVKIYEYISMGKAIISVYYKELERFKSFVNFYENNLELNQVLQRLILNNFSPGYDEMSQEKFLRENSWDSRYEMIKETIERNVG